MCLAIAFVLLSACDKSAGPAASGSTSGSPSVFPSASGSGVVASPFAAPSYSPYGFEQCTPDHIPLPDWIPPDLPLPDGIFATATEEETSGYERVFIVIPRTTTIPQFTRMVVNDWPKAGYQIGRGDSEPGEVEAEFSKPPATGAFKVQATACDPAYSVMYLIYAPNGPASPSPTKSS